MFLSLAGCRLMPHYLRVLFGFMIAAVLASGPWAYWLYHNRCFRNFRVVEEGVLYRCGQLNLWGLERLLHDYGIRTVVNLRDGDTDGDQAEEKYIRERTHVNFVRIPARAWWGSDGSVPAEKGLAAFRKVMSNPENHPVLLHCFAGIHRTGAFCAVWRMDFCGWTNDQAILEMRHQGYSIIDEHFDLKGFLEIYQPKKTIKTSPKALPLKTVSRQKAQAP